MKKGLTFSITSAALFFGMNHVASADQIHTVKEDAKLTDIAETFATTTTEIQNLNHMVGRDTVRVGETIVLPDSDIVEVKAGDTIKAIADRHQMSINQLYQLNPNLGEIIYPGQLIAVSDRGSAHINNHLQQIFNSHEAVQPTAQLNNDETNTTPNNTAYSVSTSGHITPSNTQTWQNVEYADSNRQQASNATADEQVSSNYQYSPGTHVSNGSNYYDWGQCTYYAFDRRQQLGKSVGNLWGNANNWASAARQSGYQVNHTPEVGAIFQSSAGNYGHVGVVESKNADGSIVVSEMNWQGVGQKSYRTIHNTGQYNYIH
ncbi:LysM peptidoglycan-binding domain-containing protein [Staphylococcus sp. GSSP0090]|nr:LysM peptidoglycan-binding domain-containing protein [Staphylococcus sp. GSSP0090]